MYMRFTDKLLLIKEEATEDTNSAPAGADALRTSELTAEIYGGDTYTPDFDDDGGRYRPETRYNEQTRLSFAFPAVGSGSAGTVGDAVSAALRCCGLSETITPATDVTYELEDDPTAHDSVTAKFLRTDKMVATLTGARGKLGLRMNNNILEFMVSDLIGTYIRPTTPTPVTKSYASQPYAVPVSKTNTGTITLDGVDLCLADISIDSFGQTPVRRDYVNCRRTMLAPEPINGSMTVLAPDIATQNWFTELESHATLNKLAFALVHGAAGSRLNINASEVQILNIQETDLDGFVGYQMGLRFLDNPVIMFD